MATCNLNGNGEVIAILCFYDLKEKITLDQLSDVPIDLVLPNKKRPRHKGKVLTPRQALGRRIALTVLVHAIAASAFYCIFAVPVFFNWVQNTQLGWAYGGSTSIGIVFFIVPAVAVVFIWGGADIFKKPILNKILMSLWLIANVSITISYLILISMML